MAPTQLKLLTESVKSGTDTTAILLLVLVSLRPFLQCAADAGQGSAEACAAGTARAKRTIDGVVLEADVITRQKPLMVDKYETRSRKDKS
ncbi:hypothetical protein VSDG_02007 [Cytospora chrysosperma]|uniref:Uncharacterized protein n=1 Tax=Cytospora chrysosperma TaxID=252740 RepID=A0A423WE09_CYTCH|nr:hypothetical protein VSDG_02007 [Valsa sordida]